MQVRGWMIGSASALAVLVLVIGPAVGAEPLSAAASPSSSLDSTLVQTIREVVARAHHPDLKWPDFPFYADEMRGLYAPIGYGPFWLVDGKPRKQAREAIDVLLDSPSCGLDPDDYDARALDATWSKLQGGASLTPREQGVFDTGLSVAFLRRISDVHIGRVTPTRVGADLDLESKKYDLPVLLRSAVAEDRIRATADAAEPQLAVYKRMKEALVRYRALVAQDLPIVHASGTVRPGDAFDGTAALAARLAAFGDLGGEGGATYSGPLVDALKRFQSRHGLEPDGVLGKATLAALNVPVSKRLRQLELGLERLRWVPKLSAGPFIAVNIPAFSLWAFDSLNAEGRSALQMRVVVGKALDTRTPVFFERMEYIVFRPYWNVPYRIVRRELLLELRRDPEALSKRDMEIVHSFDDPVALPATPESIAELARGTLKVRQRPGPRNALGLVKFIFPNSNNVFMHGTPSQAAFGRSRRDLSHGCVRLEDPVALAKFVLKEQPEWTEERILAAMNGSSPLRVDLKRKVEVLLFYTTALVDLEGRVLFYDDIYGHDARLEHELETAYPYQP